MSHSPAKIIQKLLIAEEYGVVPGPDAVWPIFHSNLPDTPDTQNNAICVYDMAGVMDGRVQKTRDSVEHPGIQVRVRGVNQDQAYTKIREVLPILDNILREAITIDGVSYLVQAVTRVGTIVPWRIVDEKRRFSFTVNFIMTYWEM